MRNIGTNLASWGVNVAVALTALRVNLMRSILTTLGVMIGVFAVILATAVGAGAQQSVTGAINDLGSNMALIFPRPDEEGEGQVAERGRLTERDVAYLEKQIPGVTGAAPQMFKQVQIVSGSNNTSTQAIGTTQEYGIVSNLTAGKGRFLENGDINSASRIVIIGSTVAENLFGTFDPIGETIRIDRVPFTIVGILESKGSSLGEDNDDRILMPISTMRQRLKSADTGGPDDIQLAFIGFGSEQELLDGEKAIKEALRARYRVPDGQGNPFTVRTTLEFAKQGTQITQIFQALLVAIASISLLVGGIGIMNIMLVSVTERTREIGLRMALGARRADIRNQFLVEAAVLCVIGGGIGLALAKIAAVIFENATGFPAPIGAGVALGAILFSAIIGLVFGGYPAIRASKLSPIEALRSE